MRRCNKSGPLRKIMNITALQQIQASPVGFRSLRYDVAIPGSNLFKRHYPLRAHEQALYCGTARSHRLHLGNYHSSLQNIQTLLISIIDLPHIVLTMRDKSGSPSTTIAPPNLLNRHPTLGPLLRPLDNPLPIPTSMRHGEIRPKVPQLCLMIEMRDRRQIPMAHEYLP